MASESEIFQKVLAASLEERDAVLRKECGSDPQLSARIKQLLKAHEQADEGFMRPVSPGLETTVIPAQSDKSGGRIGPYKLLQRIGEGGFGEVYMAEQEFPVTRKVAVKVIKPGMDSREVIARFESERQALALMEHPNIAQVFDAGTTESGQPYFVMELVRGVAITEFCDRNQMDFEDRLKLFISVCNAIQHAHFKGVIHRDIKPSNVLVTSFDGVPVVKVIDFGVAKATAQRLTEKTLFTGFGQMIGTPAYMSPEQAEMSGLDIDTRSDVYSLGVLLYELLTGSTPLDLRKLRDAGFARMQQMISEQEPQRPSLRISSLGQEALTLAGKRSTDIKRWVQSLQGDLDWIILKTLERDRNRRYATPGSLAADLERFLKGDAIEARAPSLWSRVQRFYRKHRAAVLSVTAIMLILILATAVSLVLAFRAIRSEGIATLREKEAEQSRLETLEALAEARQAKDRAEGLTAKITASAATLEFTDKSLLKLVAQLPELSESQRYAREYIKWYVYGALQFVAAGTGSNAQATNLHQSEWTLHAVHQGTLLASEGTSDLSLWDLKTGKRIWHRPVVFTGGTSLTTATIVGGTVLAVADGTLMGLSKVSGESVWDHQHAQFASGYFFSPLALDEVSSGVQAKWLFLSTAPVQLLEIASGEEVPLPDLQGKEVMHFQWNRSKSLLMVRLENGRVMVFDPAQGKLLLDQIVSGVIGRSAFCETEDTLALIVVNPQDEARRLHFWKPGWNELRENGSLQFKFDPDLLSFPDPYSVSIRMDAAASDWFSDSTPGAQLCWLSSTPIDEANMNEVQLIEAFAYHADGDWLLTQTGDETTPEGYKLLNRKTLSFSDLSGLQELAPGLTKKLLCGRFLFDGHRSMLLDTFTGLEFPGTHWSRFLFDESSGMVLCGNPGYFDLLLPLEIEALADSDLLLLTELTVCGELGKGQTVVPWNEETFAARLEDARTRGVFERTSPHIQSFLAQPGFWQMRRFLEQLPLKKEYSEIADEIRRLAQRCPDFRGVFELLIGISQHGEISPVEKLRLEIVASEQWPAQYANTAQHAVVPFESPGKLKSEYSNLVFVPNPDAELIQLLLQVSTLTKKAAGSPVNISEEELYAWCLAVTGKQEQALVRITDVIHTLNAQPPATSPEDEAAVNERKTQLTRLLILRYLLLTKFQQTDSLANAADEAAKVLGASSSGLEDIKKSWIEFSNAHPDGYLGAIWPLVFPNEDPAEANGATPMP